MKKSFLGIFILMAISCGQDRAKSTLMSKEQMVDFLIDLHLSEATVQDMRLKADSANVLFSIQERLLYRQHNVSDSLFIKSYQYYLEQPVQMEEIYAAIIDSLSLRQVLLRESNSE